jgi:hypothetical protein
VRRTHGNTPRAGLTRAAAQAYDGDAATNELRAGPAAARLAAAADLKAAGNAALRAQPGGAAAAEQALNQYTKALSLLRYFGAWPLPTQAPAAPSP